MTNLVLNTDLIKSKREEKKLSLTHMAQIAGYRSVSGYHAIENGVCNPRKKRVNAIAKELGLTPKQIFIHRKDGVVAPVDESMFNVAPAAPTVIVPSIKPSDKLVEKMAVNKTPALATLDTPATIAAVFPIVADPAMDEKTIVIKASAGQSIKIQIDFA